MNIGLSVLFLGLSSSVFAKVPIPKSDYTRFSSYPRNGLVAFATAYSVLGIYLTQKNSNDEKLISSWKTDTFSKYIEPGYKVLEIGIKQYALLGN